MKLNTFGLHKSDKSFPNKEHSNLRCDEVDMYLTTLFSASITCFRNTSSLIHVLKLNSFYSQNVVPV